MRMIEIKLIQKEFKHPPQIPQSLESLLLNKTRMDANLVVPLKDNIFKEVESIDKPLRDGNAMAYSFRNIEMFARFKNSIRKLKTTRGRVIGERRRVGILHKEKSKVHAAEAA